MFKYLGGCGRLGGAGLGGGCPLGLVLPELALSPISKWSKPSTGLEGVLSSICEKVVLLQISISFSISLTQSGDLRLNFRGRSQTVIRPSRAAERAHWPSRKVTQIVSPTNLSKITSPIGDNSRTRASMKVSSKTLSMSSFSSSALTIIVPSGGPRSWITCLKTYSRFSGSMQWTSMSIIEITGRWSLCFNSALP